MCVLGGGFGGLYTAIKLENLLWQAGSKPRVTLVDQGDRFVFKPLLYELLNGSASETEVAPPFAQLLAPYPIQFVQDKVAAVQPSSGGADGMIPGACGWGLEAGGWGGEDGRNGAVSVGERQGLLGVPPAGSAPSLACRTLETTNTHTCMYAPPHQQREASYAWLAGGHSSTTGWCWRWGRA